MTDAVTTGGPDCAFFDRQGVLGQERADAEAAAALAAHLAGCARCQQLDRRTQALREQLAAIPVPRSEGHWQQAVFARIAAAERRPRRSRWWLGLPVAVAAAAIVLVLLPRLRPPVPAAAPLLALQFTEGQDRLRSTGQAAVGSQLLVRVTEADGPAVEVRIYRDDAGLLLRCSTGAPCRRDGRTVEARFTIPAIGRYRVLVIATDTPLPAPSGRYEQDAAALTAAGSRWYLDETFEVW